MPKQKLNLEQKKEIYKLYNNQGLTQMQISKMYNVSRSTIENVLSYMRMHDKGE